jgi:RimJ/RimL family protein N-acetyltransferase
MNQKPSSAPPPSGDQKLPTVPPRVDLALAIFREEARHYSHRLVWGALAALAILALSHWWLEGDGLGFRYYVLIAFAVSLALRILRRRSILIGNHDIRVEGGGIDYSLAWAALDSIHVVGQVVEFRLATGGSQTLRLKYYPVAIREEAATSIIRCFEMFRSAGPLVLPVGEAMVIRSKRLELRPLRMADRDFVVRLTAAPDRLAMQLGVATSEELVAQGFTELFRPGAAQNSYGRLVMWKEETAIGMIYLFPADMILRHATLGIDLLPEFQQQGYGTEAVRAALAHLETTSNLSKISAGCFSDNLACRRLLEKAGMTYLGTQSRFWFKGDHWKSGDQFEYLLNPKATADSE